MRYVGLLLVAALAALIVLTPAPGAPEPAPAAALEAPPVAVCAVEEGSGRTTTISVLSTVDGPVQFTLFAGGGSAGSIGVRTGASGSTTVPVVDVAAVGTVGGLVELPVATSATASIVAGSGSLSAESCATKPVTVSFLAGGSTVSGETFDLHLMNPYAGEAEVELVVQSEAGIESNERFESVIVPSRSSTVVPFTQLIPGRETLSITIETIEGRVLAVGRQGTRGESAVWNAVEPALDWFLPVPAGGGEKKVVIASPTNADVDYQIDLYGPDGFQESFEVGQLSPRGQSELVLSSISEETLGVRVIATNPVVPTLWVDSEAGVAATTASPVLDTRWMLPGAGTPVGGGGSVVLMNPGIENTTISLRPLREQTSVRTIELSADALIELALESADGYLIESTSPIAALWTARREPAGSASIGVPLGDG